MRPADQFREFVRAIFEPDDIVEARCINDMTKVVTSLWFTAADLPTHHADLLRRNRNGYGIHIGASPRKARGGRRAVDVARVRSVFVDIDHVTADIGRAQVEASGLPTPTVFAASGHGLHAWWRLADPVTDFRLSRRLQKALSDRLSSDGAVTDPARCMRVPGFVNHKPPRADSVLLAVTQGRHDIHDLLPGFPLIEPPPPPRRPAVVPDDTGRTVQRARAWLAHRPGAVEGAGGDVHTFKTACALVRDFALPERIALDLLEEWNTRCDPPWSHVDLARKLRNALRHGHGDFGSKLVPTFTSVPTMTERRGIGCPLLK